MGNINQDDVEILSHGSFGSLESGNDYAVLRLRVGSEKYEIMFAGERGIRKIEELCSELEFYKDMIKP